MDATNFLSEIISDDLMLCNSTCEPMLNKAVCQMF